MQTTKRLGVFIEVRHPTRVLVLSCKLRSTPRAPPTSSLTTPRSGPGENAFTPQATRTTLACLNSSSHNPRGTLRAFTEVLASFDNTCN